MFSLAHTLQPPCLPDESKLNYLEIVFSFSLFGSSLYISHNLQLFFKTFFLFFKVPIIYNNSMAVGILVVFIFIVENSLRYMQIDR